MATVDVGKGGIDTVWRYVTGPSHTSGMERNLLTYNSAGGVNAFESMASFPYLVKQAKRFASGSLKNDVYTIRQSFSSDELQYNSSLDVQIANELGRNLAEEFLRKRGIQREYAVFTQADGKSHLLHNHIIIINPDYMGRAIAKGISFHEIADLNDQVVIDGLRANGRDTAVQEELKAKKQADDDRSVANAADGRKFGHYHSDSDAKKNKEYMTNALRHALSSATSRADFNRYLIQQGIKINRQSNDNDGGWLRKDGRLKNSLSLEYDHTHLKTKTALGLTLEQIDKRLADNARIPVRNDSTGSNAKTAGKATRSHASEDKSSDKPSTRVPAEDADIEPKSVNTVTSWETPAEVRAKIYEMKKLREKLLYKRLNLQRTNKFSEANAVTKQIEKMDVEIMLLNGQLAELKSKSMVRSTEIAREKLKKTEENYWKPGD